MKLKEILGGSNYEALQWNDVEIADLAFDSRKVGEGSLFVAQVGTKVDGHEYIDAAIERGAAAVVCERKPDQLKANVAYILTDDSNKLLGEAASALYGHPSRKLRLVGITGTNGKTTTATLLYNMMRRSGEKAGLLSTIVNMIDGEEVPSTHTTPDAIELNALLARMVEAGCGYCFMEVSSHAAQQKRIAGLKFAGGVFSNITHDHLDYHKTMAAYIEAKKSFFDSLEPDAFALTNIDDRNGMKMVESCKAKIYGYSLRQSADFRCRVKECTFDGMQLDMDGKEVWCRLVGRFNAYNLTAIYATAVLLGVERNEALRLLSELEPAAGRFALIHGKGRNVVVDYAHTPDALEKVIDTINDIRKGAQRLVTVVGCGGDRDRTKRPEMADIAARKSDCVVLTSDNPRTENPESILDDMESGLGDDERRKVLRISDRRSAIKAALQMAGNGDIVLVAGKGHETYQEINGVRHHFDDSEEVRKYLELENEK